MDMAMEGVRRRALPSVNANSGGSSKRRKIGMDFRCSGKNPTPSYDDEVSVSCCSSHGSSQTDKRKEMKFVDLKHYEDGSTVVDTSPPPPPLRGDQREGNGESSSEVEEESEEEDMDSAEATLWDLRSTDEFHIPTDVDGLQLLPNIEAPKIIKPKEAEIDEFFAVTEAENLHQLHHSKKKYNFDFAKEEPLEGRFEWRRCEQEDSCKY